jgi:hypothetical protein
MAQKPPPRGKPHHPQKSSDDGNHGNSGQVHVVSQPAHSSSELAKLTEMMGVMMQRMETIERQSDFQDKGNGGRIRPRQPKESVLCYQCRQYGHYARECVNPPVSVEPAPPAGHSVTLNPHSVPFRLMTSN